MENIQIIVTDWDADRERIYAIRHPVFVVEQQVPAEIERDAYDSVSTHVLARAYDRDIGTGRLLPDGHIGRVAVLKEYRGHSVGTAIMRALIQLARDQGMPAVELSSQTHAMAFYEKLGFQICGDPFMEAGIPHISMRLSL